MGKREDTREQEGIQEESLDGSGKPVAEASPPKREIKFRGWDEQRKVMHQDFQFVKTGDAGKAYDAKASELYGEFARLNFPQPNIEEVPHLSLF